MDLTTVKKGDTVMLSRSYTCYQPRRLVTVQRTTPTMVVVREGRFYKRDGRKVGSDRSYFTVDRMLYCDDAMIADVRREATRRDRLDYLNKFFAYNPSSCPLTDEQIASVVKVVKKEEKKGR